MSHTEPKSNLDEKKGISRVTYERHEHSLDRLDIDLTRYHEQHAGRLVLDPKYVCYFVFGSPSC
jgi:hypothetical protein